MNNLQYILTVVAKDKPGIVQALSDVVLSCRGDWLESSLSRLGGQFAGIISVRIPDEALNDFKKELSGLLSAGIAVKIHGFGEENAVTGKPATIYVEANDRAGIVEEISTTLANKNVNVEKLSSECQSASMAGYDLFKAEIEVTLPKRFTVRKLEALMEGVSDDLVVTIK